MLNAPVSQYLTIVSFSGVLSLLLTAYAFMRRKRMSFSGTFALMSGFSAIYIFGNALELASNNLEQIRFWIQFQYIGLPLIAPFCLLLVIQYTGLDKYLTKRKYIILFAIPVLTILLAWTNEWHHLLYRTLQLQPEANGNFAKITAGPWYIVHGSFTSGSSVFSLTILAWYWHKTKSAYWPQILSLLLGILLPITASFLYLLGMSPHGIDPVPLTMFITNALYFWAIFRDRLFDLSPIARDRVFESMRDGVIVIDTSHRIVDCNHAAKHMLHNPNFGDTIETFWPAYNFEFCRATEVVEWHDPVKDRTYRIVCSSIFNSREQTIGKTLVIRDITEQKQLEDKLKRLAFIDGLTGVSNRSYFIEKSEESLAACIQQTKPFSLFLFDIDHFKQINDTYGHAGGDAALLHIVAICKAQLDENMLFGRYGGEEFAVALPARTMQEAGNIAERIRQAIADQPLILEQETVAITASFGISELNQHTNTLTLLLQEADKALYASKHHGRNTVHLAIGEALLPYEDAAYENKRPV